MKQETEDRNQKIIELKDLVYAPLQAVSYANIQLSSNIVDFLSATGDPSSDGLGKTIINLRTIQMIYEQMRNDDNDNTVADHISLEMPLLSIYPLSTLKVGKSKVKFDVEVKGIQNTNGQAKIIAQLSGRGAKKAVTTPHISYEVELEGVSVAEGLARFVETLNSNAMPKQLARRPLDEKGNKLTGAALEEYERQLEASRKEKRMQLHLADIDTMIRTKNNDLKNETGIEYEEFLAMEDKSSLSNAACDAAEAITEFMEMKINIENNLEQLRSEQLKGRLLATQMEE